jgi:deoxycytidylate deaminase
MVTPFPGDTIILGFTGSIGSGCTEIAKGISKHYKYKYFCLSDILRKVSEDDGKPNPTCEELQGLGNSLRAKNKNSFLVEKLFEKIGEGGNPINSSRGIIIDSIRNDGEVLTLRQFPFFFLFSIHADEKIRLERTLRDGKFKTQEEFHKADLRDQAEDIVHGQQVKKCNYLSDIIINNNKNIPQRANQAKKDFIDEINKKYISLIELNKEGQFLAPENLPSIDESFMTMAYAESQRSSCIKRKVGAIIASIENIDTQGIESINKNAFVLSSGYNEVPFGSTPCILNPEFERCFRDFLQEEHGKKICFCPACGRKINLPPVKCKFCGLDIPGGFLKVCPQCKNESEIKYTCECKSVIFEEFLLSGGKLLDMCKALHAEENALLHLTKIGIQNSENLVLYTTTFPCNFCANKIVAAGIKKVVYADPYTMKDSEKILETGKVKTEKFQGIKSSAFFRFYNW